MTAKRLFELGGWLVVDGMIRLPDGRIFDRDYDIKHSKWLKTYSYHCTWN
jgi:hypothetical protein